MPEFEFPQYKEIDVPVELEDVNRKETAAPCAPRITLGIPVVIQLTKKSLREDQNAVALLGQSPQYAFHLVRLACTFQESTEERISEAWLRVQCAPQDTVIAWSMLPQRDTDIDEISSKVSVGADLKLLGVKIKESIATGAKFRRVHPFVEANNLQQSNPEWHFKKTNSRQLTGSYSLALIIRSLRSVSCSGTIALRCTVERSRFVIFSYISKNTMRELSFKIHD